jgi:hypothetical protein
MSTKSELLKAIAATAELLGTSLSPEAARIFVQDLADYPIDPLLSALRRCRLECRGRLTIADVVSRIDDGRPGPEQAWAMLPLEESQTCVWTEEMAQAYGVAAPVLDDRVAGRMAFREAYVALVAKARDGKVAARWVPSLGWDKEGRAGVLDEAVRLGRLTTDQVRLLLPPADVSKGPLISMLEEKGAGLPRLTLLRGKASAGELVPTEHPEPTADPVRGAALGVPPA